jgi:hypothetical protein
LTGCGRISEVETEEAAAATIETAVAVTAKMVMAAAVMMAIEGTAKTMTVAAAVMAKTAMEGTEKTMTAVVVMAKMAVETEIAAADGNDGGNAGS